NAAVAVSLSPPRARRGEETAASGLPVGIGKDDAAPAAAIERLPLAFGLRQAIGDRIDRCGMMAHAAMAALDLDALRLCRGLLHAAFPSADAVGAAEDRGGRHRRRS